jgi:hypothetical protein
MQTKKKGLGSRQPWTIELAYHSWWRASVAGKDGYPCSNYAVYWMGE